MKTMILIPLVVLFCCGCSGKMGPAHIANGQKIADCTKKGGVPLWYMNGSNYDGCAYKEADK
jgi:spore coat polysaccharide biosynthesis predicted glycosyltransferase SpsG